MHQIQTVSEIGPEKDCELPTQFSACFNDSGSQCLCTFVLVGQVHIHLISSINVQTPMHYNSTICLLTYRVPWSLFLFLDFSLLVFHSLFSPDL